MSPSTKLEIWMELVKPVYPSLNEDELRALSMTAATEWYSGEDSKLTQLFDQYVMLKTLKGVEDGKEASK